MNPIIISCKTIENELLAAMERRGCSWPVLWLESGLHNVPKKLHERLQELLDSLAGHDTVLLAMSFCGNSVAGLRTGDFQLVMPRSDDCISLLLGDTPRPFGAFFLTEGWLKGGHHLGEEYEVCLQKYGEKRGKRIFAALLKNYTTVALLDTGCFDRAAVEAEVRSIAGKLGLEYTEVPGRLDHLTRLLSLEWDENDFVRIPPHSVLTEQHCQQRKGREA